MADLMAVPFGEVGLNDDALGLADATAEDVLADKKFYAGNEELKTGTLALSGTAMAGDVVSGATFYNTNAKAKETGTLSLSGNAGTGDVLSGKTFYNTNAKSKQTGTLSLSGNAAAGDVISGKTFYNTNAKSKITGTLSLSGNANAAQVLSGYTFYKTDPKSKITGTMTNRGAVSTTVAPGGSYTIPAGYHNGSGKVYGGVTNQFVWGFIWHSNRNYYNLGTNSSFGSASGQTWTCSKAGSYKIRAVCSDSIGNSGVGVKKNGSWLFNGTTVNKTQDVTLASGDKIAIIGGSLYGDTYPACVSVIMIWHN